MKIKTITTERYSSTDLSLVATISLYLPVESVERKPNSSRVLFVFQRSKKLEELLDLYWKRELKVEPQAYFNQLRVLKNQIHERGSYV